MPSMFDDPFFGGGRRPQSSRNVARARDPFAGHGSIFSSMSDMMNGMGGGFDNGNVRSQSVSYSSSSFGGPSGGRSVSTSTSTRIINGKRQTVTERVITN